MPSFSRNLEETLHRAVAYANQRKHEYATLEHLLLSLTDDEDAAGVMSACDVDLAAIKKTLTGYLDTELRSLIVEDGEDAKPTAGFQRVIQRAVIHVQSSGRDEVTGANVLVAVFSERESHAAYFLQEQDMTRYDAVNYIAHGIAKKAGASEPKQAKGSNAGERMPRRLASSSSVSFERFPVRRSCVRFANSCAPCGPIETFDLKCTSGAAASPAQSHMEVSAATIFASMRRAHSSSGERAFASSMPRSVAVALPVCPGISGSSVSRV